VKKISRNRSVVVIWTVQIKFGHFKQNGIVGKTILKKKKKKKKNLAHLFLFDLIYFLSSFISVLQTKTNRTSK
jgi:hypothetical protein